MAIVSNKQATLETAPRSSGEEVVSGNYPVAIRDARFFLKNKATLPVAGFGTIKIAIGNRYLTVNNLQVLCNQDDGSLSVRAPRKESANKRKGASWSTVGSYLESLGIETKNIPSFVTSTSLIIPPSDADLDDKSRPWISYWSDISDSLAEDVVRMSSSLCGQCVQCSCLKPYDQQALDALMSAKEQTQAQKVAALVYKDECNSMVLSEESELENYVDPITGVEVENIEEYVEKLQAELERIDHAIDIALFVCGVDRKLQVLSNGMLDCLSFEPNKAEGKPTPVVVIDDTEYADTGDIPF